VLVREACTRAIYVAKGRNCESIGRNDNEGSPTAITGEGLEGEGTIEKGREKKVAKGVVWGWEEGSEHPGGRKALRA